MMVKAHSLLYVIYICLLVSIICGALLYFSNLYSILNLHYNLQEELYIQNQSVVNFALGNQLKEEGLPYEENPDFSNTFIAKPYGLFSVLITNSSFKTDTITSAHLVGRFSKNKTALYVANISQKLSYTGNVKINGDCLLPTQYIDVAYIFNQPSSLNITGKKEIAQITVPPINSRFNNLFESQNVVQSNANAIEKVNTVFFNSFTSPTKEMNVPTNLSGIAYKGNLILKNNDSITIDKSAILEDVIVIAPKVRIDKDFKGNIQVFASNKIIIESDVYLTYPSVICVKNESNSETSIEIKEKVKILGSVVLFGNQLEDINKNTISISKDTFVLGDIYCSGKLDFQGTIHGSIYTNKLFYKTQSATYDNLMGNMTIDVNKRPSYYIGIPLFETNFSEYGIIKKVK